MARAANTTGTALASDAARQVMGQIVSWRCPVCARKMFWGEAGPDALTVDHLIAVAKGGLNAMPNLLPLCGSCNSSKGEQDVRVWLPKRLIQDDVKVTRAKTLRGVASLADHIATELENLALVVAAKCAAEGITR